MRGAAVALALALVAAQASAVPPGTLIAADPIGNSPDGAQAWKICDWITSSAATLDWVDLRFAGATAPSDRGRF